MMDWLPLLVVVVAWVADEARRAYRGRALAACIARHPASRPTARVLVAQREPGATSSIKTVERAG